MSELKISLKLEDLTAPCVRRVLPLNSILFFNRAPFVFLWYFRYFIYINIYKIINKKEGREKPDSPLHKGLHAPIPPPLLWAGGVRSISKQGAQQNKIKYYSPNYKTMLLLIMYNINYKLINLVSILLFDSSRCQGKGASKPSPFYPCLAPPSCAEQCPCCYQSFLILPLHAMLRTGPNGC